MITRIKRIIRQIFEKFKESCYTPLFLANILLKDVKGELKNYNHELHI